MLSLLAELRTFESSGIEVNMLLCEALIMSSICFKSKMESSSSRMTK